MSWTEIKKAVNSNLDVPLNEKIDGFVKYNNFTTKKFISSAKVFTNVIDIAGKGEAHYLELHTDGIISAKITVDNNVYLVQSLYSGYKFGIASIKYFTLCGGSTLGIPTVSTRNVESSNQYVMRWAVFPFNGYVNANTEDFAKMEERSLYVAFEDELKFNQRFKVEVMSDKSNNIVVGIGYELYD